MMIEKAVKTIKRYNMISEGDVIVIGVSGGADSVSLLHLLIALSGSLNISITAAHLNHMLRGDEANRDERFVRKLCKSLNIPLITEKIDCEKTAKQSKLGIEECARNLRYKLFERAAEKFGAQKIATAHTANDNFETVLLNITRGAALKGVGGIPPVRGNIIRPIIECSRDEVLKYCDDNKLSYVTDSSNLCNDYSRNRIRNKVIPELLSINSGAVFAALRLSRLAGEDEVFLSSLSDELYSKAKIGDNEFDTKVLLSAKKPIRSRTFIKVVKDSTGENHGSEEMINAIDSVLIHGGKVQIAKNLFVERKEKKLMFYGEKQYETLSEIAIPNIEFSVNTGKYIIKSKSVCTSRINDLLTKDFIDCDTISGKLMLRGRKQGDKITLYNRNVTKTLKKLFSEEKIDVYLRNSIPVLADNNGVVWVMGFGVNAKNAVTENSANVIKIEGENI
ncbi:MAG TPA: tRNA lysidine(34) synthetase TilS [Oscillospiraceae bacterium]|nr:tRNA lysidine(34) synthetase TilS [Oscillospiraceae bacterium]